MPPPDNDVWQWIVGICSAAVSVLIGLVWRNMERRVSMLEEAERCRSDYCDAQRAEILEELRREICSIVKSAVKDMIIDHNKDLAALDKSMALQAQAMQQIQANVEAIFGRLNRRADSPEMIPTPSRRRKDDVE